VCGIAGYVGSRPAAPIIVECLQRLQYRGYDSAGLAVRTAGGLAVLHVAGPVDGLEVRAPTSSDGGVGVGIGHTRWATHGLPIVENAHPLVSCDGAIAVVHNGIIENHAVLRHELEDEGHRFLSDTDSEVIPHLLERAMKRGESFQQAFLSLPAQLRGTFAIVAIQRDHSFVLITRRGSPLIVGVGDGEYFPASDIPSFLPFTSRVLYIRENDSLRVDVHGIHRLAGAENDVAILDTELSVVDLSPAQVDKGGLDHFMIKEILEQAGVLEHILSQDQGPISALADSLRSCRKALFVGAGTSYHSALYAESCAMRLGTDKVRGVAASEFDQFAAHVTHEDLVVLISQSGETADTIFAGRLAHSRGAKISAITNSPMSTLAHEGGAIVSLPCGQEVAVAATKSYTAQLAAIALALAGSARNASAGVRIVQDARNSLYNLTSESSRGLVDQIAADLRTTRDIYLLGKGLQNVTARESALKLKEVAGVRAEAFLLGEMKHGPLSLIEDGSRVILFYDDDDYQVAETAASELSARGAQICGIGTKPLPGSAFYIRTDDVGLALPICQIAPVQLLAYQLARVRNLDPDRPRNLAKSVTVA
jgi:glucosamine--fructose-6-phosphate aminotransferase (isomerizing)